ncbi:MAG: hypothetical protein Q7S59_04490 [Sulfurimonas sp.]|nr:hypothetical protein [Sulfurimonas sp.]
METNSKIGLYSSWWLFWAKSEKLAFIDVEAGTIETETNKLKITKVSKLKIIVLKYIMPLLFLAFAVNWGGYYVAQIALGVSVLLYISWSSIYRFFGRNVLLLSVLPFPLAYLYFSVFEPFPELTWWGIMFFNRAAVYLIAFFLLENLFVSFMKKEYANFWQARGGRDAIIIEVIAEKKPHFLTYTIFNALLIILAIFGAINALDGYKKVEKTKIELSAFEQKVKANSAFLQAQTVAERKAKLDKQADQLKVKHLHDRIDGIDRYERVDLTDGTIYMDIDTNATTTHKGESFSAVTFVQDHHWFLIGKNDKNFKIISSKAD